MPFYCLLQCRCTSSAGGRCCSQPPRRPGQCAGRLDLSSPAAALVPIFCCRSPCSHGFCGSTHRQSACWAGDLEQRCHPRKVDDLERPASPPRLQGGLPGLGLGLGGSASQQEEMLRQMMSNPMVQAMYSNPDFVRAMMQVGSLFLIQSLSLGVGWGVGVGRMLSVGEGGSWGMGKGGSLGHAMGPAVSWRSMGFAGRARDILLGGQRHPPSLPSPPLTPPLAEQPDDAAADGEQPAAGSGAQRPRHHTGDDPRHAEPGEQRGWQGAAPRLCRRCFSFV